jgi:hypothetical protein
MSGTVTLDVIHLTHQPRSSLGALIRRGLVIEFTSTLLKPTGDPKPDECGRGCDFSPSGVIAGGFGWVPRVWPWTGFCQTRPIAIPTNDSWSIAVVERTPPRQRQAKPVSPTLPLLPRHITHYLC